eukprot:711932-Prorocentrum_minimum.AAC.1
MSSKGGSRGRNVSSKGGSRGPDAATPSTSDTYVGSQLRGGGPGGGIRQASLTTRLKVKNTRGTFKACCRVHEGHKRPKRGCYQRCKRPGFPGASSVCNVLVPRANPSPVMRASCG